MAVITKANIIEDVNENLHTKYAGTELDRAIIKTLTDMSNRALLTGTASPALASGDVSIPFPTGYRNAISITLIDGTGLAKAPLKMLQGGHREYRNLRHNDNAEGVTEWYSENDDKIWLWRPANAIYTTLIEYYKNHAKTADAIEFTTEFENLMFAGTTYFKALAMTRKSALTLWAPEYDRQMKIAMLNRKVHPSIVGE